MKLIVGLGNPGKIYIDCRHNIGFSVIKALAKFYKIVFVRDNTTSSLTAKIKVKNQNIILAMPLTYMNLSGLAVRPLLKKYKIDLPRPALKERSLENLLVVCDDLDLELGRLKIRASGSSGGQRGLGSIIDSIGNQKFCRLRIGIGRPKENVDSAEYVLSPFTKKEKEQVKEIIEKATECCRAWVSQGITESMNIFNKRDRL